MEIEDITNKELLEQHEETISHLMGFIINMEEILASSISDKERVQGVVAEMNELYHNLGWKAKLKYIPSPVIYLSDYKRI